MEVVQYKVKPNADNNTSRWPKLLPTKKSFIKNKLIIINKDKTLKKYVLLANNNRKNIEEGGNRTPKVGFEDQYFTTKLPPHNRISLIFISERVCKLN